MALCQTAWTPGKKMVTACFKSHRTLHTSLIYAGKWCWWTRTSFTLLKNSRLVFILSMYLWIGKYTFTTNKWLAYRAQNTRKRKHWIMKHTCPRSSCRSWSWHPSHAPGWIQLWHQIASSWTNSGLKICFTPDPLQSWWGHQQRRPRAEQIRTCRAPFSEPRWGSMKHKWIFN